MVDECVGSIPTIQIQFNAAPAGQYLPALWRFPGAGAV
jgi:hypothetical protein